MYTLVATRPLQSKTFPMYCVSFMLSNRHRYNEKFINEENNNTANEYLHWILNKNDWLATKYKPQTTRPRVPRNSNVKCRQIFTTRKSFVKTFFSSARVAWIHPAPYFYKSKRENCWFIVMKTGLPNNWWRMTFSVHIFTMEIPEVLLQQQSLLTSYLLSFIFVQRRKMTRSNKRISEEIERKLKKNSWLKCFFSITQIKFSRQHPSEEKKTLSITRMSHTKDKKVSTKKTKQIKSLHSGSDSQKFFYYHVRTNLVITSGCDSEKLVPYFKFISNISASNT